MLRQFSLDRDPDPLSYRWVEPRDVPRQDQRVVEQPVLGQLSAPHILMKQGLVTGEAVESLLARGDPILLLFLVAHTH